MKIAPIVSIVARPWLWFTKPLELKDLHQNPMVQFARWYRMAQRCIWLEFPDAVCLASADHYGNPDSRMVLLKDFDMRGFVFFTNYESPKSKQMLGSGQGSLTFFWDALQRQVRVKGEIEKVSAEESDLYFRTRSRLSQIAAWASHQSSVLAERSELDSAFEEFVNKFKDIEIPRPENWGGFRLRPKRLEFWKAGRGRLHDRFLYESDLEAEWKIRRLSP